jgi:hypothetical protein
MKVLNLALAFVLQLCALAAWSIGGVHVGELAVGSLVDDMSESLNIEGNHSLSASHNAAECGLLDAIRVKSKQQLAMQQRLSRYLRPEGCVG